MADHTCAFSLRHYKEILQIALSKGYRFIKFNELEKLSEGQSACLLRHDVDYVPEWSLGFAEIESHLGIISTYFYQVCAKTYNLRESTNVRVVRKLKSLGHEIGLHLDLSWKE